MPRTCVAGTDMNADQIAAVLASHFKWSQGEGGKRADLRGADLTGADLSGAKINNDKIAIGILRRAMRSDGYEFFLWHCEDGFYIKAGCRFFTMEEGRKHWKATRAGTPLGDETQDILAMFAKAIKRWRDAQ